MWPRARLQQEEDSEPLLELELTEEVGFLSCRPWWAESARCKEPWGWCTGLLEPEHSGG